MASSLLGERERRILARLEHDPTRSAEQLGKELRLKSSAITYSLRKLQEANVIRQRCVVNAFRLGFMDVGVFFSLSDQTKVAREQLLERAANHPHVVSLQSLLGDFQYKIIFLCRGLHEVQTFLSEVFSGAGDVFTEKLVAPRLGIALYQKKYLDPTYKNYTSFDFAPNGELFVPDDFDQRLLYQLGAFPFESMRKLAQTLSAPYSTIERRIKKLRELKVIEGFYWDIDLCALGMQAYRLLVMKKGICLNTKEKLAQFCAQHPHITFLVDAIGAWDFEIGVEASGTRTVNQIVEELYGICGMRIAWIKVLMEDKNYKCSFYEINPVKQLGRVAAA